MKKHSSVRYGSNSEIIEIVVRDCSGAKVEQFKFNSNDKKTTDYIARLLFLKYGIQFDVSSKKKDDGFYDF